MENISAKELSMCRISDGILLDGSKPTAEIAFHTAILQTRPDVNVVLHFQSPYATALACRSKDDANYFVIPEIPFYIGHVTRIPYLVPGSRELGEAVANAMQDHNMAIMSNHGLVTVANDYSHAIQNAAFFELACEIIAHGGETLNTLSEADVEALIALRHTAG
jgi:ribulose-5-phosphate 4-epimerase/fuculose-1-phosphate aldolase